MINLPKNLTDELNTFCKFIDEGEPMRCYDFSAMHMINDRYGFTITHCPSRPDTVDIVLHERLKVDGFTFIRWMPDGETDVPVGGVLPALMRIISRHPEMTGGD